MVNNGVETYGYGAGNRRLWKQSTVSGSWVEVYLYGLGGEVLEVFGGMMGSPLARQSYAPTQRAWFGGRLIEKKGTAMNADRLGTYEKSFPYGELATAPTTSGEKFATYWRDAGTGLDYAVNRYYSPQMGRFLSADPYQASGGPAEPGSWNRYAYVEGDPVNRYDPKGLDWWDAGTSTLHGDLEGSRSAMAATGLMSLGGLDMLMPETGDGEGHNASLLGPWYDPQRPEGLDQAAEALSRPDCASLIAGAAAAGPYSAGYLAAKLNAARVTTSTGHGNDPVLIIPEGADGRYSYVYQFAWTENNTIYLNGNYFPDPGRKNISTPSGNVSLLELVNRTLQTNMNAVQFSVYVFLHELSHMVDSSNNSHFDVIQSAEYNISLFYACIN
ncbi:MAG: RHS repeat-associated core domain-containing protein [Bryobacterales bacterium]|nr:RHS repeat-associated core domain-containing protein [Bryobacterales bacterium]